MSSTPTVERLVKFIRDFAMYVVLTAAMCVLLTESANAVPVIVCGEGAGPSCGAPSSVDDSTVTETDALMVCRGADPAPTDAWYAGGCVANGGSWMGALIAQLIAGDLVAGGVDDGWHAPSFYTFGGEEPPEEPEECSDAAFSPSCLDSAQLGAAWAAGFIVVATGMVIGMSFKLVLSMLK